MSGYEYIGLPIVEGTVDNILHMDPNGGSIRVFLPQGIREPFEKAIVHFGNQSAFMSYSLYRLNQPVTFKSSISAQVTFPIFYELYSGVSLLDTSGIYKLTIIPFSVLERIKSGTPFYLHDLSTLKYLSYRYVQEDTWTGFPYIPAEADHNKACRLQYLNNKIRYIDTGYYLCTSLGIREKFFENGLSNSCQDRYIYGANDTMVLSFDWEFDEIAENQFSIYTPSLYIPYRMNLFTPDDNTPTGIAYNLGGAPSTQWRALF